MSDLEPKTRREVFLNGLSDSEQTLPEPVTREEMFLKKAIEAGGGGGGSSLPEVTSEDNGKVLTVVDGEWDKGENPKELPEVTSTDEGKALVVDSNGKWSMGDVPTTIKATTTATSILFSNSNVPISFQLTQDEIYNLRPRFIEVETSGGGITVFPLICSYSTGGTQLLMYEATAKISSATRKTGRFEINKNTTSNTVTVMVEIN